MLFQVATPANGDRGGAGLGLGLGFAATAGMTTATEVDEGVEQIETEGERSEGEGWKFTSSGH